MRKKLILAVAVILGLAMASPVYAATLVVDDDGFASAADCDAVVATDSLIQDAVNAAFSGDTILVCPGTYTENVDVNTNNLTIVSTGGASVTTVDGIGAADEVFHVAADGVMIEGFEIMNGGSDGGILFEGDNNVFANNVIHGNSLYGIVAWDSGVSDNNKITRNEIYDNVRSGILIGFYGNSGNEVTHNDVHDNGSGWLGIELINGKNSSVTHNNVHGSTTPFAGIYLANWTDAVATGGNSVAHNDVDGTGGGFLVGGITVLAWTGGGTFHGFPCSDVTNDDNAVVHNNVHDNGIGWGIALWALPGCDSKSASVDDNTVAHNTADTNAVNGIDLIGDVDENSVHKNTANSNSIDGIRIRAGSDNNVVHHNTANNNGDDGIENLGTDNKCFKNSASDNVDDDFVDCS